METPWQRAKVKTASQRQEERNGRMPFSSKQPNSGRFWRWKRDGIVWNFLVEARTTTAGSYRVDKEEFQKVRREAITTPPGLKPGMQIDLGELQLWVMELPDWEAVYTRLVELESRLGEQET
jgi:hypothetical protein